MGTVYEAQNISIGKRVALKFIAGWGESAEASLRFQREAEAASAVESPNIVHVFDTGATESGQPYLVMELLQGESLGALLRRGVRLSIRESVHVISQILRGLERAHEAGVIHRDLKPDNIFLVSQGDDLPLVKILDFGISKISRPEGTPASHSITREGVVLGTPHYMSPEQAQALPSLDARSDLFSVGVLLFECLVGHSPWSSLGSYEAIIVAICSRDTPDVRLFAPEVPAPIAELLKVALARDLTVRFPSASAFLSALQATNFSPLPHESSNPSLQIPFATLVDSATKITSSQELSVSNLRSFRRSHLWFGVIAALLAFGATSVFLYMSSPRWVAPAAIQAPPEVTMRIEVHPPSALLFVDGKLLEDRVLRGLALSEYELRVEAEGYEPLVRHIRLDGRPMLHLDLTPIEPAISPSASSTIVPAASHEEGAVRPPTVGGKAPASKSTPSVEPSAGKGLQLKVKL